MQNKINKKAVGLTIFLLFIMVAIAPAVNSFNTFELKSKIQNNENITYDVYFGTTNPPPKVVSNQTETTYGPGVLDHETTYYWQIIAWDESGNSAGGPIWHFTTVANQAPVAIIIAPSTADKKVDIQFDGSDSYDPDGYIVDYSWVFSDGAVDNGMTVTHQFQQSGDYTAVLIVEDDDGNTDEAIHDITINNNAPIADFVADQYYIQPGDTVTFDGTGSYDPDGDSLSYSWMIIDTVIGTDPIISYTFTNYGNYEVILTVTDDDVNNPMSNTVTGMIYVNAPPIADFTYSPQNPFVGDTVTFDGSNSYDPDGGPIVNYSWDFGDIQTGYGMIVYHQFMSNGWFTVTLTVTDDMGATGVYSEDIYVQGWLDISEKIQSINMPKISHKDNQNFEKSESFMFYPPRPPSNPYPEDGAVEVPVDVTLTWTGGEDNPPVTPVIYGETNGLVGEEYEYCIDTVVDPDGDSIWVFWDWGDGTNSDWQGPYESGEQVCDNHSWEERGIYTIKARLKDDYGALSDWGYLEVSMPKNKILHHSFLQQLFQNFPNAFPILKYLNKLSP